MNRWGARIIGLLILLVFVLLMLNLQNRLATMKKQRDSTPASGSR